MARLGAGFAIVEEHHFVFCDLFPEFAVLSQLNLAGCGWDMLSWVNDSAPHAKLVIEDIEPSLSSCRKSTQLQEAEGSMSRYLFFVSLPL